MSVDFRFWAVTRLTGATLTVAAVGDGGFPAARGAQLLWVDTLVPACPGRHAPRIAPDVGDVRAYREAL